MSITAIEGLVTLSGGINADTPLLHEVLPRLIRDKDYSVGACMELGRTGAKAQELMLRSFRLPPRDYGFGMMFQSMPRLLQTVQNTTRYKSYKPLPPNNRAVARAAALDLSRTVIGAGGAATSAHNFDGFIVPPEWSKVPITVVGSGAAGTMLVQALRRAGFTRIAWYDRKPGSGIWDIDNVHLGSKNNPRDLKFGGSGLSAAPGEGTTVREFIQSMRIGEASTKPAVHRWTSADFFHQLDELPSTPIMINCTGFGKPVSLSDPERMVGPDKSQGIRWQEPTLTNKDIRNQRFIFIGLGNSTAEMLRRVHTAMDEGIKCDYRVITHYPKAAVHDPWGRGSVRQGNQYREYQVFRDLTAPNLTSYQGDLPLSRIDYFRALNTGRIISDVKRWAIEYGIFTGRGAKGDLLIEYSQDRLYALCGYRHRRDDLVNMNIPLSDDDWPLVDYDGEVPGKKGYFIFGSIAHSPWHKNSIVIPGMMYTLPMLMFGVIMRAGEYIHDGGKV